VGRFTKMRDRFDDEIENNIQDAVTHCRDKGLDFYVILTGIDAYFEKRKRKEEGEKLEHEETA
jgi:hypothetical protein